MLEINHYLPEAGKINREGFWVSENYRQCSHCRVIFERTSLNMTWCLKCNNKRVKECTPEYKMHQRAKQRAKAKGLEFNINVLDIVIPQLCPILGTPMVVHKGKSGAYRDSASLDRKDSSRGYTRDNIWVISQMANAMKGAADQAELKAFADWILSQH
jgi:hypothetical protein